MTDSIILSLSLLVLVLPLVSYGLLIAGQRVLPRQGDWLSTALLGIAFLLSLAVSVHFLSEGHPDLSYSAAFTWLSLGPEWSLSIGVLVDNLSALTLTMVTLISFLVHLYSIGYMHGEERYGTYFAYLGLFTFSMLGIVLSDNLFTMYMSWELVGLSSYLLIGFWYKKPEAAAASTKAFVTNRIGDIGMWLGILILWSQFQTVNLSEIAANIQAGRFGLGEFWLTAGGVLLFLGAVGKSAQFPLHVWLPDAMEGPTPVSALIHAATMVAAGVYFVGRIFPILTPDAQIVIAVVGGFTAFMAATMALTQNDIKRILAYSTVSQLGYMIMGLGVGAYSAALFHLFTHAFFKACLFLGSGAIIHALHHEQDIRQMGGLRKKLPITFATYLVATAALAGLPLFTGFLSKDAILAGGLAWAELTGSWAFIVPGFGLAAALLTAFYMGRQVFMVFFGEPRNQKLYDHAHEVPPVMWIPLVVLSVMSLFPVFSLNPLDGATGWFMSLIVTPVSVVPAVDGTGWLAQLQEATHHVHWTTVISSVLLALTGLVIAWLMYMKKAVDPDKLADKLGPLYRFSLNKWYFDEVYEVTVIRGNILLAKVSAFFDTFVIDMLVNLAGIVAGFAGLVTRKFQSGRVQTYVALALTGLVIFFVMKGILS
ncbi:MAG: NADH-quinone oxidoreductase subunit L [Bacteroidetes bacterium]|nr:NADH-quinone oxidoreductase subunit L [Bacteroidota bacterium]